MKKTIQSLLVLLAFALPACLSVPETDAPSDDDEMQPQIPTTPDAAPEPQPTPKEEIPVTGCPATPCDEGYTCNASHVCERIPITVATVSCAPAANGTAQITVPSGFLSRTHDKDLQPTSAWTLECADGCVGSTPWGGNNISHTIVTTSVLPNESTFGLRLREPNGSVHWANMSLYGGIGGGCSVVSSAFRYAPAPTTNGMLACTESGSQTQVALTGILGRLAGGIVVTPDSSWRVMYDYGGTQSWNWVSDTYTYPFTMNNTVTGFQFKLVRPDGVQYWLNVGKYNVGPTGVCKSVVSQTGGEFVHTPPQSSTVGTIRCQLMLHNGALKRQIAIIPNATGGGLRTGIYAEGSAPSSPESVRLAGPTLGYPSSIHAQAWIGDLAEYDFYLDPSTVVDVTGFVADNNDLATGTDTFGGGDFFDLATASKWTVVNGDAGHGASACTLVNGFVRVQ